MLPVFLTLLCKVYFMRAVARTRRLYSASPIRPEWLIRAVHSREYLCIYLSPDFCGIHRDKPVDKKRQFSRVDSYFFIHKQLWTTFPAPLLTISQLSTGSTASMTTTKTYPFS